MGRTLRFAPAGGTFHITTRGNRKQITYEDEIDRSWFLTLLDDVVERCEWSCLAYCLMSNHYHLVVHTPKETLSQGMQRLNGLWAQRFNWRHGFEGHLFERPFRSSIAKTDDVIKEFVRYTLLNPVRAGVVERPGDWQWSSYRASAGHVPAPRLLDVDRLYRLFDEPGREARATFVEFIAAGIGRSGRVLGPGPKTTPARARVRPEGGRAPRRRGRAPALRR